MDIINVSVKTDIVDGDGNKDSIEFTTEGKIGVKNGKTYIYYKESEVSGMDGCLTTIRLEENRLVLKRYGSSSMELEFEVGKNYEDYYRTPYGIFEIKTNTKKLEIEYDGKKEGNIFLEYELQVLGLVNSHNVLQISFK